MKPRRQQPIPKSERGAAMLAALCLAMVFALCLSSYMAVCYNSLRMSARNMMSSHAVQLAEAGLEQGLYAQNNNDWSAWTVSSGTATLVLSGFTFENGATGQINLTVANYGTSSPLFSSEALLRLSDGTVLKRQLQTQGTYAPTFVNAAGATLGRVSFNSGGTLDSYDSSLGTYSSQTPGYSAVVLSESTSTFPGVRLNTADVNGYVIGVSSNPVSYSAGAEIIGPNTPNTEMIDPTRIISEPQPNQPQYTENVPSSATAVNINLSGTQTMTLGSPTATVPTAYYILGDMTLAQSSVLSITGPVILVVYGNLSITDSAQISIANTSVNGGGRNVSLEMHVAYGDKNIDGGGITNNTQSPERLLVMSTWNQNGTLEMGTSTPFYGVIDFPANSLTINGNPQIYGAVVAGSITFTGSPAIHYDVHLQSGTSLAGASPSFAGPMFNAFESSVQGTTVTTPVTISNVVEVAAQ